MDAGHRGGGPADESADLAALSPRRGGLVGGSFASTQLTLGSAALAGNGQYNIYVAHLDTSGIWQQATAANAAFLSDLAVQTTGEAATPAPAASGPLAMYLPPALAQPGSGCKRPAAAATTGVPISALMLPATCW